MEDAFLCAKHAVALLHAKLFELRAKASKPALAETSRQHISRTVTIYLSQLQLIHTAVHEFLLQLAREPSSASASTVLLKRLQSVSDEVPGLEALESDKPADVAAQVRQLRAAKLDDDLRELRAAVAALPTELPAQADALASSVRSLSQLEQSLQFHVRLTAEVSERFGDAAGASYSADNFAYGSTPYTTWLKVLGAMGPALQHAMFPPGREYVVWGSSCGWLVLYGALTYGWRSRGVELLSYLHGCSERVAGEQAAALAGTAGVCFTCGDLLQDDVSAAGLVVLADQCWDEQLAAAAVAKLARELPQGAICVSYSGSAFWRMASCGGGGGGGGDGGGLSPAEGKATTGHVAEAAAEGPQRSGLYGRVFEDVVSLRAPASWNELQTFHVLRRV